MGVGCAAAPVGVGRAVLLGGSIAVIVEAAEPLKGWVVALLFWGAGVERGALLVPLPAKRGTCVDEGAEWKALWLACESGCWGFAQGVSARNWDSAACLSRAEGSVRRAGRVRGIVEGWGFICRGVSVVADRVDAWGSRQRKVGAYP